MRSLCLFLALCLSSPAALAGDALPGVKQPEPIVQPAPEPEDQPASEDGSFMVGNTKVKISGSVTVDIGAGKGPPPRR